MLTKGQKKTIAFIAAYQKRTGGVSPSCVEIAAGLGIKSKGRVSDVLSALEERGCIRRLRGRARAIEIIRTEPLRVPPIPRATPFKGAIPIYDAATHEIRGWLA